MSIELVVARYLEDLSWINNIPPQVIARVYDKSPGGNLPNVGREAHTYLHHICANYHDLPDLTVFAQGKPFDHAFDFHKTLRALAATPDETAHATMNEAMTEAMGDAGFRWLGHIIDTDDATGARLFATWSKNNGDERLDMDGFHLALFGTDGPQLYTFVLGAQFVATRALIRARPLDFWQRALQVSTDFPDAAHCYERSWDRVFGVEGVDKNWLAGRQTVYLKPIRRLTP